jgi:hypothetical protein
MTSDRRRQSPCALAPSASPTFSHVIARMSLMKTPNWKRDLETVRTASPKPSSAQPHGC